MPYRVFEVEFPDLARCLEEAGKTLTRPVLYSLPVWLQAWWKVFGGKYELCLRSVYQDMELIGIAPLMRQGSAAGLLGSPDVCDYLDFIVAPGRERSFFEALLPRLREEGVERLELNSQRPEGAVFSGLFWGEPRLAGPEVCFFREGVSYEIGLTATFEGYLEGLKKKQRHEVRRKLRRLENESRHFSYSEYGEAGAVLGYLPHFLTLFRQNPDKEVFLTETMENFFRVLVADTAAAGLARFGRLEIDGDDAAAVLYFVHGSRGYLYNSGYSSAFKDLSAGLLCKIFSIQSCIGQGLNTYDFLKGSEVYKSRLGGVEVPVYRVDIALCR